MHWGAHADTFRALVMFLAALIEGLSYDQKLVAEDNALVLFCN